MEEEQNNEKNFRASSVNSEINLLKDDHINFKLSLRKKKVQ